MKTEEGDAMMAFYCLLRAMGRKVKVLDWQFKNLEGHGIGADVLFKWEDEHARVKGTDLRAAASRGLQLFEGTLVGRSRETDDVEIGIRAIRGFGWDVEARDARILKRLRKAFPGAMDLPEAP